MNPDLYPIKNLQSEWETRKRCRALNNFQELMQIAVLEWKNISLETYANLLDNYRKKLLKMVSIKGHATDN